MPDAYRDAHKIIEALKAKEKPYLQTKTFSQSPGIYAFFFIGDNFPVFDDAVSTNEIIYIGKTESSQEKRDAKTHFTSGKTESSTFRRSIGALLCESENLKPIPRNNNDYQKRRLSHFKFDERSEMIITDWMKNNLALSFYEYPRGKQDIEQLETEIIQILSPKLNISKNHGNPFKDKLQRLRKKCAQMAFESITTNKTEDNKPCYKPTKSNTIKRSGLYIDIWTKHRQAIKKQLQKSEYRQSLQLEPEDFESVGNRNSYAFNLEFSNGIVSNNIGGSAVARDLAKVLENSSEIMDVLKGGYFKINMDRQFCLWINKIG